MSSFLPVSEASAMTARFRTNRETILASAHQGNDLLPICETFDKAQVETLLGRSGCTQLRCYYSMDEDLKVHLVLVGVNDDDEDILPSPATLASLATEEEDYTLERANRCPDFCPPDSELNS